MHRLVLKTSSSWTKFSGGFLGSITEYMVVKDFWQPSTDSPTWWTRSCRRTMEPRRRASTQRYWYPKIPSQELWLARKLDDSWQQGPSKYLGSKIYETKSSNKRYSGAPSSLHCSCSHVDLMISVWKASHSLSWTIFAIRTYIWLSREDTFFNKPKDFPAWSMAVLAYRFSRDSGPLRSAILDRCSAQWPSESCPEGTSESAILVGNEPCSSSGVSTSKSRWTKQNRITLKARYAKSHKL
jgi:hypothetical protein